ncbi:2-polyprenylphenol 6-hydroxylase [Chelativorans multitrophicus]|uniref:2-polyprenylphenol 6-hydroxylase n=1 Tax=Chelativorans multitrophicus TaxID=449973 RepID=UPI00140DD0E3|nr:2-polyprenylphenol 6-hydroxylase [Chelativorans multitrophicus]
MSTLGAYLRLARAGWILLREGVIAAFPGDQFEGMPRFGWRLARLLSRRRSSHRARTERLAIAVDRLGPTYVKLGQFLATRPDVVGHELARDLASLQDRMDTFPQERAVMAIEASLGAPVGTLYREFGAPVAAASIAQVHPAKIIREGEIQKVAVKVIRPGVRRRFYNDLESFFLAARLQERFIASSRRLRPVEVTQTLAQTTKIEMDLRLEAAAISEIHENSKEDPGFRVPWVDWQRTGRDVLTLEWIDGIKMSDTEALRAAGHDLERLATTLIQSFLRHTLRDGFFHADMHPGNLFVEANGTIVAVDFGIVGRIGRKERRFLAEILYGFITRDFRRVAEVHFEAGYVPSHHDVAAFAQALRAIGEPIHGQPAETISMARLLTLLFEVTELFDMQTRPELLLLQKTMVVVEGVSRTLDPHFNMWRAAEPVVSEWIEKNLGPQGLFMDAREGAHALMMLVRQAPELAIRLDHVSRGMEAFLNSGLRLETETTRAIGRARARYERAGHLALWVIALLLFFFALRLL